jgi:hypothetical protein
LEKHLFNIVEQNPIRLNYEKLCLPQASKIQITTAQIGWLFAVIEAKSMRFDSIKWTQNLIDRAIELRISYSILAREKLKEDLESSRKPLWDDDRISVKNITMHVIMM